MALIAVCRTTDHPVHPDKEPKGSVIYVKKTNKRFASERDVRNLFSLKSRKAFAFVVIKDSEIEKKIDAMPDRDNIDTPYKTEAKALDADGHVRKTLQKMSEFVLDFDALDADDKAELESKRAVDKVFDVGGEFDRDKVRELAEAKEVK